MSKSPIPLAEFDDVSPNVIEPSSYLKPIPMPENVVLCFYAEVLEKLKQQGKLREIYTLHSQMGKHPLYELIYNNVPVAVLHPGVGAPLAAALMEETIALGGRKFLSCGSGGVLNKTITVGHILVPTSAVRDEGTSFHYIASSREISATPQAIAAIDTVLNKHQCKFLHVKTWTTDSFYRETVDKVTQRKNEGCLAVEMECSAFCAVAQYRNVAFGQMIYAGDDISCAEWDRRREVDRKFIREQLFWFTVEASLLW